jgi:Cyclic phosphodiesterase-like protein.
LIFIWLCPSHEDELYIQKIINKLSENYNSPIFLPHCTLLGGLKLNEFDLENIIDISIDNIGLIKIKSNGIDYTNTIWKTLFIKLVLDKKLKTIQEKCINR